MEEREREKQSQTSPQIFFRDLDGKIDVDLDSNQQGVKFEVGKAFEHGIVSVLDLPNKDGTFSCTFFPDCMKYAEGERGIRLFFNSKGILRSIDMDSIPEIVNLLDFCEFYADGELMRNEIVKFEKDPTSMKWIDVRLLQRDV